MTNPVMFNEFQQKFDYNVAFYPQVRQFSNHVRNHEITRNILAAETSQEKTPRSIAKKFKQIVIGIDRDEQLSVVAKIEKLIEKLKICESPDSPFTEELRRLLVSLEKKLTVGYRYNLLKIGIDLKPAALESLENPQAFYEAVHDLHKAHLLNDYAARVLSQSHEPETLLKKFCLQKWDLLIVDAPEILNASQETDPYKQEYLTIRSILKNYFGIDHPLWRELATKFEGTLEAEAALFLTVNDKVKSVIWERLRTSHPSQLSSFMSHLKTFATILDVNSREILYKFLIQENRIKKCRHLPEVLAKICLIATDKERDAIWRLVNPLNEIEFLSHFKDYEEVGFLSKRNETYHGLEYDCLVEDYKRSPKDLAVIYKLVTHPTQKHIWEELIVRKGKERVIEFLSQVGKPGAIDAKRFRKSITPLKKRKINSLVRTYKKDAAALAAISKLLSGEQRKEFWQKTVVRHHLEREVSIYLRH